MGSKKISLENVLGKDNPADILTKYVDKDTLNRSLPKMNLHKMSGRPESAPAAMRAARILYKEECEMEHHFGGCTGHLKFWVIV